MRAWTFQLSLASRLENVELAGAVIRGLCAWIAIDLQQRLEIELCAVEAITNSIRHAYEGRPGHEVRLEITVEPERIVLRVEDDGRGVPVGERQPRTPDVEATDISSLREGGRGLLLIVSLMDDVEFETDSSTSAIIMSRSLRA